MIEFRMISLDEVEANGVAGEIEREPDGSPAFQHFVGQVSPMPEPGTPVVIMTEEEGRAAKNRIDRYRKVLEQVKCQYWVLYRMPCSHRLLKVSGWCPVCKELYAEEAEDG